MRTARWYLIRILLLAAIGISYFLCIKNYREIEQLPDTVTISCSGGFQKDGNGDETWGNSTWEYALWEELEGEVVSNPNLNRQYKVSVTAVRGSFRVLLPQAYWMGDSDGEGCFLDRTAALGVFGSTDVVGKQLLYEGRQLTVRGVTDDRGGIMLIRPKPGEALKNIILSVPDGASQEVLGTEFMAIQGIQGTVTDNRPFTGIVRLLVLGFPFTILLFYLCRLNKVIRGMTATPVLRMLATVMTVCLALFTTGVFLTCLHIPRDYVPTKWSDFSFYTGRAEYILGQWKQYFQIPKSKLEIPYVFCSLKSILYGLLSQVFFVLSTGLDRAFLYE